MIPPEAELTERPDEIPAWDDMPDDLKPVLARQMEVYAGFLEHTDHHVGRLLDALAELAILEDTLVYYIIGDNGASAEGTPTGCFNELVVLNGAAGLETPEFMVSKIDDFGTPEAYNHYAVGWAHAMDTPYQWTKQVASHWGGTRNGTIVHWPNGIKAKGEIRSQFHHVIDVAATVLEAAGLPAPLSVNGVQQRPLEGVSMAYTFDDAAAADRHTTQYFEMFCNRGIYHEGWTAVTRHSIPWVATEMPAFDDDVWELYAPDDWSQAYDLAADNPDKLRELQRSVPDRGGKYNVLPLDDRRFERFNPDLAGRPQLVRGNSQLLFGAMGRLSENSVVVNKNKSFSITAELEVPEGGAEGVIISQGGAFGGFSLYVKDGKPAYCYNLFGLQRFKVYGEGSDPRGRAPGADGVHLRRRRSRQGRRRRALPRRRGGRRPGRRDGADALLRRRDDRRRLGHRHSGQRRLRPEGQRVHGEGSLGPDRHRRGRRGHGSPDHARGAPADRDGAAVVRDVALSCCRAGDAEPDGGRGAGKRAAALEGEGHQRVRQHREQPAGRERGGTAALHLGRQVGREEAERRSDAAGEDDPEPEHPHAACAPARGGQICGRGDALRDVRDEDREHEAEADRQARADLDPEDDRFGHAVDDRADDDSHRPANPCLAEATLDRTVGDEEDGHADEHPERELPPVEHVLGLDHEVEGDRRDQRAGAEAGQGADDTGGNVDPAGEETGEKQRGCAEQSQAERLEHAAILRLDCDTRITLSE